MRLTVWAPLLVISLCAAVSAQVNPNDLLKQDLPSADHELSYGPESLQFGELRLPITKTPHAIVVLVHGGCWLDRLPEMNPRLTTFELLRPLAAALTREGFATWNVEYRRAGNVGGGWPGSFLDLGSAIDFLRGIATTYNLDLNRVIVIGHSSGGQLAMWIAARSKLAVSSPVYSKSPLEVKAVVNIDGPPDLASAQPQELRFCPVPAISQFLGGTPGEQPERYRDASALSFLPLEIPQHIIVGGLLQASELVGNYYTEAEAKGDHVTVHTFEGAGHFDMLFPDSRHGGALVEVISALARLSQI